MAWADSLSAPLEILYEDEHVVAVHKPEGLASIPPRPPHLPSALRLLGETRGRLWVVHRLDREASGVLLFAKTPEAHRLLCLRFQERQVRKAYLALVWGTLPAGQRMVEAGLRECGSGRVAVDHRRGKPSSTRVELLATGQGASLVVASPTTGRRHQVRVHLFHLGHPVVGDRLYGDTALQRSFPRLMLHAWAVSCALPWGLLRVVAPPPPSFTRVLASFSCPSPPLNPWGDS